MSDPPILLLDCDICGAEGAAMYRDPDDGRNVCGECAETSPNFNLYRQALDRAYSDGREVGVRRADTRLPEIPRAQDGEPVYPQFFDDPQPGAQPGRFDLAGSLVRQYERLMRVGQSNGNLPPCDAGELSVIMDAILEREGWSRDRPSMRWLAWMGTLASWRDRRTRTFVCNRGSCGNRVEVDAAPDVSFSARCGCGGVFELVLEDSWTSNFREAHSEGEDLAYGPSPLVDVVRLHRALEAERGRLAGVSGARAAMMIVDDPINMPLQQTLTTRPELVAQYRGPDHVRVPVHDPNNPTAHSSILVPGPATIDGPDPEPEEEPEEDSDD